MILYEFSRKVFGRSGRARGRQLCLSVNIVLEIGSRIFLKNHPQRAHICAPGSGDPRVKKLHRRFDGRIVKIEIQSLFKLCEDVCLWLTG